MSFWNNVEKKQLLDSLDTSGIVSAIKNGKCKKILVMTGAGISVAAGIPDFRSPGTGLYSNLKKYNLPFPEAVFQLDYFKKNPKPFFDLALELYPENLKPTTAHYFIRLLHEKGLLLRNYTQNIDTLELEAQIPEEKVVFAHGSFAKASCISCSKNYTKEWIKEKIFSKTIPKCEDCQSLVKPDIIFFGEDLPQNFFSLSKSDFPLADLLIVIGTSLTVYPFAGLISKVNINCPRVLINLEPVGSSTPLLLSRGQIGFDFGAKNNYRDVPLLGNVQDICLKLIKLLGWEEDFEKIAQSNK